MGGRRDASAGVGRAKGCAALAVPVGLPGGPDGAADGPVKGTAKGALQPTLFSPGDLPAVSVRRGRKRHVPCPVLAQRIAQLRSEGHSIKRTAQLVGLHENTLFRHYAAALGSQSLAGLRYADPEKAALQPRPMRGRPLHVPTIGTSDRVRELVAEGLPVPAIAAAIGITAPTLRRHYARELSGGAQVENERKGKTDGRRI